VTSLAPAVRRLKRAQHGRLKGKSADALGGQPNSLRVWWPTLETPFLGHPLWVARCGGRILREDWRLIATKLKGAAKNPARLHKILRIFQPDPKGSG
jgi:hypothetical protein